MALALMVVAGCQSPTPTQGDVPLAKLRAGSATGTDLLGPYTAAIISHGAVHGDTKVIEVNDEVLKRMPTGAELSGAEPKGTIVIPKGADPCVIT